MKVKITAIRESGNLDKERVVMLVESACDIGEFVLLQTGFQDGSANTSVYKTFWFPDKSVRAGDFVVVYTKRGANSERPFKEAMSHFFYLGQSEAIWNRRESSAVLMHAPVWQSVQANST